MRFLLSIQNHFTYGVKTSGRGKSKTSLYLPIELNRKVIIPMLKMGKGMIIHILSEELLGSPFKRILCLRCGQIRNAGDFRRLLRQTMASRESV